MDTSYTMCKGGKVDTLVKDNSVDISMKQSGYQIDIEFYRDEIVSTFNTTANNISGVGGLV